VSDTQVKKWQDSLEPWKPGTLVVREFPTRDLWAFQEKIRLARMSQGDIMVVFACAVECAEREAAAIFKGVIAEDVN